MVERAPLSDDEFGQFDGYERTAMWGGIGYPSAFFTANEFDFVSRIEDLNEQGRVLCSQGVGRNNKCSKRLTLCM